MNEHLSSSSSNPRDSDGGHGSLVEGAVFGERYRVVRCLATGAMGAVYEVVHVETHRRRALKVMHPHLFESDEMRERFKREARIAAQVESEYIVDVSDAGVDEDTGTPFLVMELLQGEELGRRLKRAGHLPPAEVVTYLQQVALALDRTHSKMIVHRDLKPENVFLTQREDGSARVKILDFGVAKLVAEGATGAGLTRSVGTPLYMAPEQFHTGSKLLPAADIYALGMMAYTLLTGEPYWMPEARKAGDVIAFAMTVLEGIQESAVARAAVRGVELPPEFDTWFQRISAVEPVDRFPRASEAVSALARVFGITVAGASAPPARHDPLTTCPEIPAAPRSGRGSGPTHVLGANDPTVALDLIVGPVRSTVPERVSTSTGGTVSLGSAERPRRRVSFLAAVLVSCLSALVTASWLAIHSSDGAHTGGGGSSLGSSGARDSGGAPGATSRQGSVSPTDTRSGQDLSTGGTAAGSAASATSSATASQAPRTSVPVAATAPGARPGGTGAKSPLPGVGPPRNPSVPAAKTSAPGARGTAPGAEPDPPGKSDWNPYSRQ